MIQTHIFHRLDPAFSLDIAVLAIFQLEHYSLKLQLPNAHPFSRKMNEESFAEDEEKADDKCDDYDYDQLQNSRKQFHRYLSSFLSTMQENTNNM